MQQERERLQDEGAPSGDIRDLQPRGQWYKPDGTPVWPDNGRLGPMDSYHVAKFRAKGWLLAPPAVIQENIRQRQKKQRKLALPDQNQGPETAEAN